MLVEAYSFVNSFLCHLSYFLQTLHLKKLFAFCIFLSPDIPHCWVHTIHRLQKFQSDEVLQKYPAWPLRKFPVSGWLHDNVWYPENLPFLHPRSPESPAASRSNFQRFPRLKRSSVPGWSPYGRFSSHECFPDLVPSSARRNNTDTGFQVLLRAEYPFFLIQSVPFSVYRFMMPRRMLTCITSINGTPTVK